MELQLQLYRNLVTRGVNVEQLVGQLSNKRADGDPNKVLNTLYWTLGGAAAFTLVGNFFTTLLGGYVMDIEPYRQNVGRRSAAFALGGAILGLGQGIRDSFQNLP